MAREGTFPDGQGAPLRAGATPPDEQQSSTSTAPGPGVSCVGAGGAANSMIDHRRSTNAMTRLLRFETAPSGRVMRVACAMALAAVPLRAVSGQGSGPGLVVPVPDVEMVEVAVDSFTTAGGRRAAYTTVRPLGGGGPLPVVVFANAGGTFPRSSRGYQEWARLVTTRGMAGVLYDADPSAPGQSFEAMVRAGESTLDSVIVELRRTAVRRGLDPARLVLWAGSAQTSVGTPVALEGQRPVAGYVLYYGGGRATNPRVDVPVLMVRAGLDSPALNAGMDSLSLALTRAGVTVTTINHASGSHGFDIYDQTATSAHVIRQTLDFIVTAVDSGYRAAVLGDSVLVRAAAAYAMERWSEAARLYGVLAQRHPNSRIVAWRQGLALLAAAQPVEALVALDRAKALGQGGARDIGLPATRAALRAGQLPRAVEWINWALQAFPMIRTEIVADRELAPLLDRPDVRRPTGSG